MESEYVAVFWLRRWPQRVGRMQGPECNKHTGLWMQRSSGTVWHLCGPEEDLRERASTITAGDRDHSSVSLLLKAGTIDSGSQRGRIQDLEDFQLIG